MCLLKKNSFRECIYANKGLCHCCLNGTTARGKPLISRSPIRTILHFNIFQAGDWVYKILNTHTEAQGLSITVITRAASVTMPPVLVKSYVNQETNSYPSPMVIYAEVTQGFLPVVGAEVTSIIESASGISVELELFDDGSGK